MNMEILDARPALGGYRVDPSRGQRVTRVSSEWFSRPEDERFLSLDDLYGSVKSRAARSRTQVVESAAIRVEAQRDNPERLELVLPGNEAPIAPTHWSFGQLASIVGAPATYLRQLPAPLGVCCRRGQDRIIRASAVFRPSVLPREQDMCPAERRDVRQEVG